MTSKTQTSLRLDTDKLIEAKAILERLGLNFSEAVNIFTNMIVATKGLPFDVRLPNDETIAAMRDVRERKNLTPVTLTDLQRELQNP
ncbi:type II toxin-antitoxin system RelB/DinJ family antitoxin [Thiothrix winogradskyi]|uniref:Type II toxin-antitoxin system RelB/DinJ family antitoxin n=2 Tax=Thiothrix winogradskyi TaxID=96472 RepID=A0ABY3SWR8_9GAMM|nr:type II toxin-antitoxin system RelB/DinJ family antitoxin [Thiothrix winogradskyi]